MTSKQQEDKKRHAEHSEPKISELEKWLEAFRLEHGHNKLMSEIRKFTHIPEHKKTKSRKETGESELKISDIEKIFMLFRQEHGHEKLKESVSSVTREPVKEPPIAQPKHIVYKDSEIRSKAIFTKNQAKKIPKAFLASPKFIKEKLKHKKYRYPAVVFGVFLGIYFIFNLPVMWSRISWQKPQETQKLTVKTQEVVQKKMENSAPLSPGEVIPAESRLVVPKIKVNVPVVYADTRDEKGIENLLRSGVVHYQGTANPGEVGNSFITGHSSNYWWDTGKYNYAFVLLDKLEPGDQAVVYYNGKKFVYTVRDKVVVEATDVSVLAATDTPVMTLMTCTPPGTSWKRLIVRLDQTDPVYYKPQTVTKEQVVESPKDKKQEKSFLERILSLFTPN